jgi:hypothetical protein
MDAGAWVSERMGFAMLKTAIMIAPNYQKADSIIGYWHIGKILFFALHNQGPERGKERRGLESAEGMSNRRRLEK